MDAKEISQVVFADCKDYIDGLKKEYGELIVQEVYEKISEQYTSRIDRLEKENKQLLKRLERIESEVEFSDNNFMNDDFFSHDLMDKVIDDIDYMQGTLNRRFNTKSAHSNKVDIDSLDRWDTFEYNGWYYYSNKKMGNFLYRVRTDGTGNERLTDYSVGPMDFAYVEGGRLHFVDSSLKSRNIEL